MKLLETGSPPDLIFAAYLAEASQGARATVHLDVGNVIEEVDLLFSVG